MTLNRESLDKLGRFLLRNDCTGGGRSSLPRLRTDLQLGVAGG